MEKDLSYCYVTTIPKICGLKQIIISDCSVHQEFRHGREVKGRGTLESESLSWNVPAPSRLSVECSHVCAFSLEHVDRRTSSSPHPS